MWLVECVHVDNARLDVLLAKGWEPFAATGAYDIFLRIEVDSPMQSAYRISANGVRVCPFCFTEPWSPREVCPCGEKTDRDVGV